MKKYFLLFLFYFFALQRLHADPVLPEVGTNDFPISAMGPLPGDLGSTSFGAFRPSIAYNSIDNRYLAVWYGDDNTGSLVNDEFEIYVQQMNASGSLLGSRIRISQMDVDGNANIDALNPSVAYNSHDNEYLVIWYGDTPVATATDHEYEIFAQRLNASTGILIGSPLRISHMGTDGDPTHDATNPSVAYDSTLNQYLVTWQGNDIGAEFEIYGQIISNSGTTVGSPIRLTHMGADGNTLIQALLPSVAYDHINHQYLLVWQGDELLDNAFEIFGQRLSPSAAPLGSQFKISDMTSSGLATNKDALDPMVIYNEDTDQFFVVWFGDRAVATEYEIYGQIINADTGSLSGENIKISQMGGDGLIAFDATNPAVTYDNLSHSYIVTWTGDEATDFVVDDENEIYTQQVDAVTGLNIETSFRISDMGPDRDPAFDAVFSAIDYSQLSHQALVIWSGHDRADDDFEIFGQVYASFVTASGGSGGGSGGASGDGSGGESAAGSGGDLGAGSGGSSGSGGVTSDASGGVSGSGIETSSGGVSGTGGGGSGGTEPPAAETGGSSGEVGTITGASGSDGTPETLNDSAANGSCGLLPHS